MKIAILTYKAFCRATAVLDSAWCRVRTLIAFAGNGVRHSSFRTTGVPYVRVARSGRMTIGTNFTMHNGIKGNPLGSYRRCTLVVRDGASLSIGDNVGISHAALIAIADIKILNNVKLGGGTCIYTSDFHSLDPVIRASANEWMHRVNKPVVIEENVFIGAHSIILKGVTIGRDSVIGAGSVVTKSIPPRCIAAGNPCRVIRQIEP